MEEAEKLKPSLGTRIKRFLKLDKPPYVWELQAHYTTGSRGTGYGWHTIWQTDTHEPKPVEVADKFEPGVRYRVLRRNLETGRFDKICWTHYEPLGEGETGGIQRIEEKIEEARERRQPLRPADVMSAWAQDLKEALAPLQALGEIRRDLLSALGVSEGGEAAQIPPLQFSGAAPWFMHPYVMKYGAEAVKDVIGYTFDRIEKVGKRILVEESEESGGEEGATEEVALPRPIEFVEKEETPTPTAPVEEIKPEEKPRRRRRRE